MNRLFLDDIRNPIDVFNHTCSCLLKISIVNYQEHWHIVRSYNDFTIWITQNGLPDLISFDHDLGDYDSTDCTSEKTGYDCAKWLVEYCLDNNKVLPEFAVHSANPIGAENIKGLLKSFIKSRN
ncbi:MAG: cyclic-phosphate processing receiver domain-containing protein [Bacteroidota bacterium]